MNIKLQVAGCRLQVPRRSRAARKTFNLQLSICKLRPAFTLLELLVVIAILGILAALSVPALKSLGKSNVQVSAARQMLDDVARARQLAISHHTTVYMVFVPPGYWAYQNATINSLTATTNLLDKQFTGYNFLSLRSVGDQPGQGFSRYLSDWKALPDGAFIATNKFNTTYWPNYNYNQNSPNYPGCNSYSIAGAYPINSFSYITNLPFPVETNFSALLYLPYIAFNYLGQLTVLTATAGEVMASQDEYIPLAQGTVAYAADPSTKALQFATPDASETPPGNSFNSMFHVIRIDRLTGRAVLLQQKVQ